MSDELRAFKDSILVRNVVARVLEADEHEAMEFPSQEALQKYLQAHPGADPENHTVKQKSLPRDTSEAELEFGRLPKKEKPAPAPSEAMTPDDMQKLIEHAKARGISDKDLAHMLIANSVGVAKR